MGSRGSGSEGPPAPPSLGEREAPRRRERERVRRPRLGAVGLDGAELRELPARVDRAPEPQQHLPRGEPRLAYK